MAPNTSSLRTDRPAVLFDLDGTLLDSVYQHVLAWKEALESAGIPLSIWRIHRPIGISGGPFVGGPGRGTGRGISQNEGNRLPQVHPEGYTPLVPEVRPPPGAPEPLTVRTD